MERVLIAIAALSTIFAILMVVVASRRWTRRLQSIARVEALRELVLESPTEHAEPEIECEAPAALDVKLPPVANGLATSNSFVMTVSDRNGSFQKHGV